MHSIRVATILSIGLMLAPDALACSVPPSHRPFVADSAEFHKAHSFPEALDAPTPIVRVTSIQRGDSNSSGSCGYYAFVTFEVSVPKGSPFSVSDLGFVFRTSASNRVERFMSFPNVPAVAVPANSHPDKAIFRFAFPDSGEDRLRPFKLPVEVFAVNKGLQVGASAIITVEAP